MLYPLTACETQPRITLYNITLKNIDIEGSVLPPGIIRCNETNPCHDFTFENVNVRSLYTKLRMNYIMENVYGEVINSFPDPGFAAEPSALPIYEDFPIWDDDYSDLMLQ